MEFRRYMDYGRLKKTVQDLYENYRRVCITSGILFLAGLIITPIGYLLSAGYGDIITAVGLSLCVGVAIGTISGLLLGRPLGWILGLLLSLLLAVYLSKAIADAAGAFTSSYLSPIIGALIGRWAGKKKGY